MRHRSDLNNILIVDRKMLYIILCMVIISILTLTVVYAALSTTLDIDGNAEVSAASWDIYLDNIQLNSNSVTVNMPTIVDKTTVSFSTTLSEPGDFYEFTIDVVNNGSIDAMIDSVTKTPELSDSQKKYLNYIVEYQNGKSITTKQLVLKNSFVRLKVKVEYRKNLSALDLPNKSETLSLSFKINYIQSDDNGISIANNGMRSYRIVSGDLKTVGSEVAISNEHFYIISSAEDSVTMLAKYNLEVGNVCTSLSSCTPIENASGIQNLSMIGVTSDSSFSRYGTISFSPTIYWGNVSSGTYIYDSNSTLYNYVENYKAYLESLGVIIIEAGIIKMKELEVLGCSYNSCRGAPSWVYATSYWTGSASNSSTLLAIHSNGNIISDYNSYNSMYGVRPVIVLKL